MLVFAANRNGQRTGYRVAGETINRVKAAIGASVVINDRLPEVVSVTQRRTRDSREARVDGIEASAQVHRAVPSGGFIGKLAGQSGLQLLHLPVAETFISDILGSLLQEARAFHACPGADAQKRCPHISQSSPTLDCRIDPAVQRNVRGAHVFRRAWLVAAVRRTVPTRPTQIRVVMTAVNLFTQIPTEGAANEDVGDKVLASGNAGNADSGGHSISEKFGHRS